MEKTLSKSQVRRLAAQMGIIGEKKEELPVEHPWVAVDFDGTLMEDGHYPGFGPPRARAREAIYRLKAMGVKIMVFTARTQPIALNGKYTNVNKTVQAILNWGEEHDIPIDYVFPLPKPTFVVAFFDDRAIRVGDDKELQDLKITHKYGWDSAIQEFEFHYSKKLKGNWAKAVLPDHLSGGEDGKR